MTRILIIGATSAIAEATARLFAQRGAAFYLIARDPALLGSVAADLQVRGASRVEFEPLDANDFAAHEQMLARALARLGGLDVALIAHGTLSSQAACQKSVPLTLQEITTNGLSVIALSTRIAEYFEQQRAGTLVVISSVAGDRGRQSNYVYGSAKALVTTFLSGLRQRLQKSAVQVITVKPGFVDTPMTREIPKNPLWAKPPQIARGILRAIDRKRDVVYLPVFWRPIMFSIRCVPERLFKRLKL